MPRPQNMANASIMETSESVNGVPFSFVNKHKTKKEKKKEKHKQMNQQNTHNVSAIIKTETQTTKFNLRPEADDDVEDDNDNGNNDDDDDDDEECFKKS